MQRLLFLFGFVWLVSCVCVSAEVLTNDLSMTVASSAMQKAGYAKTGLDMMLRAGEDLQFWRVDRGVLIVSCATASRKIVRMTFWYADERPKGTRQTFEFDVESFDTGTGLMTIRTRKSEDGAANGSLPVVH